ncbi:MAG: hypothetical protein FWE32_10970 [Oscillospiraceae bacterium]|nr:hypothetical protein [Oscillospiraceae bacterium]
MREVKTATILCYLFQILYILFVVFVWGELGLLPLLNILICGMLVGKRIAKVLQIADPGTQYDESQPFVSGSYKVFAIAFRNEESDSDLMKDLRKYARINLLLFPVIFLAPSIFIIG